MTSLMKILLVCMLTSFFLCGGVVAYADYPGCVAVDSCRDVATLLGIFSVMAFFFFVMSIAFKMTER